MLKSCSKVVAFYLCVWVFLLSVCISSLKFCPKFLCTCVSRSVSLHKTFIPKICQTTKVKMFVHMRFVNSYMAVTANGNVSS